MAKTQKKKVPARVTTLKTKINALKRKLDEMKQYKQVMAAEGVKPDADDKERESKLIVQLLRHEKELAALEGRPVEKRTKTKKTFSQRKAPPSRRKQND